MCSTLINDNIISNEMKHTCDSSRFSKFYFFKNQFACHHCGQINDRNSNSQKYCQRKDNPECDDDRFYSKLWSKFKHPLQLNQ
jgi:hypothetical protein